MKKPLHITIPIAKIDEDQRMVYGYATVEELDSHGDIITYEASKKAFSNWIGNIREMHQDVAVGKALDVEFDDDAKGVWIGARISESEDGEQAWIKIKEGVYAGFSIGGSINEAETKVMETDTGKTKPVRVITDYDLGETSVVDNPAVASAVFQMVKRADDGGLDHVENIINKVDRPVAWWEKMYKFADDQKVMRGSILTYNENSMGKSKQSLAKSLWQGQYLAELAMCLADYIYWKAWDGEDVEDLKSALQVIQQYAAEEILEEENFPELETAIEAAAKALNIKKEEELTKMAKEVKELKKTVVGQEDRDANAEVVTSAEENGRPVDDTEERAAAAAEAEEVKDDEVVEDESAEEVEEADEVEEDAESEEAAEDEEEEVVEDKGGKKGKGKKSASAEFKKSTEESNDLAKSILSGVEALIEKSVTPLKEEIETLKKQAAPSKVKSTHTVKKGEDVVENQPSDSSQEGNVKDELDVLLKRADELSKDANVGTPEERMQVAFQIRKKQRQLDPASVAKHNAVRATFRSGK